ncbi:MAG: hypothetical protein IPL46_08605 [Saprospiraceae bacterium]|nr:hypothetical protein [Saprospiraceae bacterium]
MKITKENYEEFALDFIEGNLNAADRQHFEHFLNAHPAIRKNIDDFELVVLPSFTPIMPNKSTLYRDNSKIRPILFYVKNIAAIILVLILLSTVLIQLNKQPTSDLEQLKSIKENIQDKLPYRDITLQEKPEIKISNPDIGLMATTTEKSPSISDPKKRKIRKALFSETEIAEPKEELVLITPNENEELHGPIRTMALIEKIDFKPDILLEYKIDHRPNNLLIENEEIQNDPFSKIGRLLARANLLPTGLQEEIGETSIREKVIPETYVDLK